MKFPLRFVIITLVVLALIALIKYTGNCVTLEQCKIWAGHFKQQVDAHYITSAVIFIALVTLTAAASIPIIIPIVLVGGYLFNTIPGALLATAGTTLGSVISFLLFRYALGATIQRNYGDRLAVFNEKMNSYGPSYLLVLHYLTVVPFFIINTFAALTPITLTRFVLITLLGSLPINLVYSFAGRELGSISSTRDIFSPAVIAACLLLILLACMPIILKKFKGKVQV